ncbi:MAG: hypothetical protein ACLRPW_04100 [Intestinibacter sp.]
MNGLNWFSLDYYKFGGILADEMGLVKQYRLLHFYYHYLIKKSYCYTDINYL